MSAATISLLVRERCWTHPAREAAARCPSCGRSFCRECVTEHDGRLVCAGCLRDELAAASARGRRAGRVKARALAAGQTVLFTLSVLSVWLFFHLLAQTLMAMPSEFHADTLWQKLGVTTGSTSDD